jgi:DNA-binding transcriptional regulator YhcF (GntR family)
MAQQRESGVRAPAEAGAAPAPEMERADDVPVGVQLAWRLRALIISGHLGPGERLPGVRELAQGAAINVNTARAVYRRLEREGLAVTQQGLGTFVSLYPPVSPALEQVAADAIELAADLGVNPRELARTIYSASVADGLGTGETEAPEPPADPFEQDSESAADAIAARRSLQAQIANLEAKLAPYPEKEGVDEEEVPAPPHVADLAELEATRDRLIERLNRVRQSAEQRGARYDAARGRLEEMVADPASHKWEVVDREATGEIGCGRWEVRPVWGPVGALMNWWRVKLSSGCP